MLLFISLAGFFLSLILLVFNAGKYRSSVYLGLFFLFLSLYGFFQYILIYSKSVWLISMILLNLTIIVSPVYLIGPMLFWYIRGTLTDNPKLGRRDIWHFLPAAIFFLTALNNFFIPWDEKIQVAKMVIENPAFISEHRATFLARILPNASLYLGRLFLVLAYTIWSFWLLISFLVKKKTSEVFSSQNFMKSWLFHLLGFTLVLAVSQIILMTRSFEMQFSEASFALNIIRIFSAAGLIGLLISPFFFPSILYGLPRLPDSTDQKEPSGNSFDSKGKDKVKAAGYYEESYLNMIGDRAESCMQEQKPYLQADCNIGYISKLLNIPAHHLAYYFREVKKQKFNDFRNEWRVNHAKELIREGKAGEMTLEAIGSLSGFSSRNAFITDFKKVEGMSPGSFASKFN